MAWAKHSGNKLDSPAAATTLTSEPANIELRCVTKRFGEIVAADHIDLRISAGEFLSLLGPSGMKSSPISTPWRASASTRALHV
jgi:ABC-type glutathione transport system ATPase component